MNIDDEIRKIEVKIEERNRKKKLLDLEESKDVEVYHQLLNRKKLDEKRNHRNELLSKVGDLIKFASEREKDSTVIDACKASIEKLREIIAFLEK